MLAFKAWYYETAIEAGTNDIHANLSEADVPEELRPIYLKLKNDK